MVSRSHIPPFLSSFFNSPYYSSIQINLPLCPFSFSLFHFSPLMVSFSTILRTSSFASVPSVYCLEATLKAQNRLIFLATNFTLFIHKIIFITILLWGKQAQCNTHYMTLEKEHKMPSSTKSPKSSSSLQRNGMDCFLFVFFFSN